MDKAIGILGLRTMSAEQRITQETGYLDGGLRVGGEDNAACC